MSDEYTSLYDENFSKEEPAESAAPSEQVNSTAAQVPPISINLTVVGSQNAAPAVAVTGQPTEPSAEPYAEPVEGHSAEPTAEPTAVIAEKPSEVPAPEPSEQYTAEEIITSTGDIGYVTDNQRQYEPFYNSFDVFLIILGLVFLIVAAALPLIIFKRKRKKPKECAVPAETREEQNDFDSFKQYFGSEAREKTATAPPGNDNTCQYASEGNELCRKCSSNPKRKKGGQISEK